MDFQGKLSALRALCDVLNGPRGESVAAAIRIICGIDRMSFRPTPHETAYAAGLADAGRKILAFAEIDPDQVERQINNMGDKTL